jgi:hypothetical protein
VKNTIWQGSRWLHQERILIESERKKMLLQEAMFTTTMSKARPPKRKEEYVPPDEIKEFCKEILEAGRHLASVRVPVSLTLKVLARPLKKCSMLSRISSWLGCGSPPA